MYQGGTSPVPATTAAFSYKNYNHLGVFLLQNNKKKKSAEASVDDFLQNISFTFLPKTVEDLPESILREEGWRAKGLTRGNRLSFTSVLTNDVIITRSGLISFFRCVGYSCFAWHWSCQCYSKNILLNEGMGTLALPRIFPVGNKQHLASTTPCGWGSQTPKQVHLQSHKAPRNKANKGHSTSLSWKYQHLRGYFCNRTNPNTLHTPRVWFIWKELTWESWKCRLPVMNLWVYVGARAQHTFFPKCLSATLGRVSLPPLWKLGFCIWEEIQ